MRLPLAKFCRSGSVPEFSTVARIGVPTSRVKLNKTCSLLDGVTCLIPLTLYLPNDWDSISSLMDNILTDEGTVHVPQTNRLHRENHVGLTRKTTKRLNY